MFEEDIAENWVYLCDLWFHSLVKGVKVHISISFQLIVANTVGIIQKNKKWALSSNEKIP